jgi:hypothetical protein
MRCESARQPLTYVEVEMDPLGDFGTFTCIAELVIHGGVDQAARYSVCSNTPFGNGHR